MKQTLTIERHDNGCLIQIGGALGDGVSLVYTDEQIGQAFLLVYRFLNNQWRPDDTITINREDKP